MIRPTRIAASVAILIVAFHSVLAQDASAATLQPSDAAGSHVAMLAVYILLALGFSFLCSIAEAVLLSITPSYIHSLKARNPKRAALLRRLKQDYVDRSLAAILTLNTIAHTVGAIGAGAEATIVFGSAWFGVFSAVMTLLILFLSEIVPKTIGAIYWTKLAGPVSSFIRLLIIVLYPVVWISEVLTRLIAGGKSLHVFSREEFVAMAHVGKEAGQLQDTESSIIQNLLRLDSLRVADIMTPRTVVMALPESMSLSEALGPVTDSPFSRIPVYGTGIDDMKGFVLRDDILINRAHRRDDETLTSLRRDILGVRGNTKLSKLLDMLLAGKHHIARVTDEYGGTRGLVTLEDLVETLMGLEIIDETDSVADMQAKAREQWKQRAKRLGVDIELIVEQ